MKKRKMKLMIAYDGSMHADAAIADLSRAGFPTDAEVLVASVTDFSAKRMLVPEFDLISAASTRIEAVLARGKSHRESVLTATEEMAANAARRIQNLFPTWEVSSEILEGTPADALLGKAEMWKPDVIIGGSQGRSAIGRFFLGSVSKAVAQRAGSSVRIVRPNLEKAENDPVVIILGASNPDDAQFLVKRLAMRDWPSNTSIQLVGIDDGVSLGRVSAFYPEGSSIYETIAEPLVANGLEVSVRIEYGDPRKILPDAAVMSNPDAIFIADRRAADQPALNPTVEGLVTGARCTVEIVR